MSKILPALSDVPFVFPTPTGNPKGVLTQPRAGTAAVMLCDLEDMIHFALTYDGWDKADYGKSARGWAENSLRLIQIQSTPEKFADLPEADVEALNYACTCSRMLQSGDANLTMTGYTASEKAAAGYRVAPGVGALPNDNYDENGKLSWRGYRAGDGTAREAFYGQMISDINRGSYLYTA